MNRWHRILPRAAVLPLGLGAALLLALGGCGDVNANAKKDPQTVLVGPAASAPAEPPATTATAAPIRNSHSTQKSILQDDNQLLYASPSHVVKVLHKLKSLGVDVVKVSMVWWIIAPAADSTHHPSFDASNPAAYPPGGWARYDLLAEQTHKLGMKLFLQFAPKNPAWAAAKKEPHGQGNPLGQVPNLKYFTQFAHAVGERYDGHFKDAQGHTIPKVTWWGVWNEPNWRGWLNPWRKKSGGRWVLLQPNFYRGFVNAVWKGLSTTGHAHDTILIGETANVGSIHPLDFIEDLYCVNSHYRPLSGSAAQTVECPKTANRSTFMSKNPGLFHIAGWAHHPYGFDVAPDKPKGNSSEVTLFNIGRMEQVLGGVLGSYHEGRRGGIPLYLTEWGYVTNPPNPAYKTTLSEQAAWLDEGEFMTWRDPYIKSLAQFLLVDVGPYWKHPTLLQWRGVFDSGLELPNGKAKPALKAYRLPIWLPFAHTGHNVSVWGQLRPANHHGTQKGIVQFQRSGTSHWITLRKVKTTSSEGFVLTRVTIGRPGYVRLQWKSPSGSLVYSRSVAVS